ncbi:hypothetical protein SUGI_0908960 [Cryptomeria japonica]|nr:hypothetical protein SUGI_0908950 [Cryptomeria japonica]GLJ43663.1 hypothetical protein SUGI_0908960 [Cryptomeria japonica]
MAKGVYVFLMLLLLAASVSSKPADHPGYCRNFSGNFKGACLDIRAAECNTTCKHKDNQEIGECHDLICYCYHKCRN